MAKGIISNAAGATTGFFYQTRRAEVVSESEDRVEATARIRGEPHRGETAEITLTGRFDLDADVVRVDSWSQSIDGELHFSLKLDRLVDFDQLLLGNFRESLTLIGNRFANVLEGDRTDDRLIGNGGADTLGGFRGADVLTGGAGADTFVYLSRFDSTEANRDTIRGFGVGRDKIDLTAVDAVRGTDDIDAFTFIGADAFTGTAGELRVLEAGENTQVLGDINGDGVADFAIRLAGGPSVGEADFLL